MLLAIDIGNSRTKFGVYVDENEEISDEGTFVTDRRSTPVTLSAAFSQFATLPIKSAIISSVVPDVNDSIAISIRDMFGIEPTFVTYENIPDLQIRHSPKNTIGTDRLVNSFAAKENFGTPVIVCSLGTATTIDVVLPGDILIGGMIAPGLPVLSKALNIAAAKLPLIEIAPTDVILQSSTDAAIRSGIFNGYVGMVSHLIESVRKEIAQDATVIATGGVAEMIRPFIPSIDVVDRLLTLDGLRFISERIHGK